MQGVFEMFLV